MASQEDIDAAFVVLRAEWNKAEGAIKLAEQVNEEIVNPAIYELRYAGRRIIEAFDVIESDKEAAILKLRDAHFDCCRARHDAIDAATSKMVAALDNAKDKLGVTILLTHFADAGKIIRRLGEVRAKIALSREDRENRDKIYAVLQSHDLSEIVSLYDDFRASEGLMRESAKKERRATLRNTVYGWAGLIGLVVTVVTFILR